jgi:hypothetical protein
MDSLKNPEIVIPGRGKFEFPDAHESFEKLYRENCINSSDDSAVVIFLKKQTGFFHTSGKTPQEERRALELAYISDIAEDTCYRTSPSIKRLERNNSDLIE